LEQAVYRLSDRFHKLLFAEEQGVEPLLIADHDPRNSPQRIFLVRYVIGEGGGGESKRPVFKDELIGYDYEMKLTYPTQKTHLDGLQSILELSMYGSSEAQLSKAIVENSSTKEQRPIKAIVSEILVAKLVGLYRFDW
jgi:hypothetical protein